MRLHLLINNLNMGLQSSTLTNRNCFSFQLVAISIFNLRKLIEQSNTEDNDVIASCVSDTYGSKLDILCEAYEHYASGIPRAMALLDTCRQQPRFQQYLQQLRTEGADFSIQEFLFSPIMVRYQCNLNYQYKTKCFSIQEIMFSPLIYSKIHLETYVTVNN